MSRVFAYARVSTVEQLTENQRAEIEVHGYVIEPRRYVEEKVSGSVPASQRPGFAKLLEKLEKGDTLVVTKLDRLGRDSIDLQQTVERFTREGVRLVVLQLGNVDLTDPAGALMLKMLAAVADFERSLIIERTQAGLARAKAEGKTLGRPSRTTEKDRQLIRERLAAGESVSELARVYGISRATVISVRDRSEATA